MDKTQLHHKLTQKENRLYASLRRYAAGKAPLALVSGSIAGIIGLTALTTSAHAAEISVLTEQAQQLVNVLQAAPNKAAGAEEVLRQWFSIHERLAEIYQVQGLQKPPESQAIISILRL